MTASTTSSTASSSSNQAYLTPLGAANPLKDALLARYQLVRNAFNQTAFIESLNLSPQVLADIWLPVGFAPVSFEPLSEEEEKVAASGQFGNANARSGLGRGNNPPGNYSSPGSEYRRGSSHANANNPNHPGYSSSPNAPVNSNPNRRPRGVSTFTSSGGAPSRNFRQDQNNQQQHQSYPRHNHHHQGYDEDVIEDPDNLWATPSADTMGASDFGSFDENGIFKAGGGGLGALEDFTAASATFDGFMQGRPSQAGHANVTVKPSTFTAATAAPMSEPQVFCPSPVSPPSIAIPLITPDTQWLYRDPSGQIQGPFPSHRMIEWYNGKYFPENLPLRREQDPFFEPLSTWKSKCAGQVPFIAYTTTTPRVEVESAPIAPVKVSTSSSAATVVPKTLPATSTPLPAQNTNNTRNLPLESLFAAPTARIVPPVKPSSPDVLMPGSSSASTSSFVGGWKKLDKPASPVQVQTTKFGQLNLESHDVQETKTEKAPFETKVEKVDTSNTSAPSTASASLASASTWSNSSTSAGSLKKISLSEILKTQQDEPVEKLSPVPSTSSAAASAAAGWAKLSSSPVQSISKIQAEEPTPNAKSNSSSSSAAAAAPSSSKSFADLVRSVGTITSGNIVVSPSTITHVPLTEKKIHVPSSSYPAVSTATSKPSSQQPQTQPQPQIQSQAQTQVKISSSSSQSIDDWCFSSLKQSGGLSKAIDPQTCTILLMDLPNSTAIYSFALETLKPLVLSEKSSFDLASFAQELSNKKFGTKASEKVQWSKLKISPITAPKQEESFEVVKRKK